MSGMKSNTADPLFKEIELMYKEADPAHDFSHIMRVYNNCQFIGEREGADMQVLLMAALLHDIGSERKSSEHPEESNAIRLGMAEDFLKNKGIPEKMMSEILYAVDVHRFSKGIMPTTLEAKVLQDADRLDAIGAIGIARAFSVGGALGRGLYDPEGPFCRSRSPDDKIWTLDHFFTKLLKLEPGMHTETARAMAMRRHAFLKEYLQELENEIRDEIDG
ncbi:MAG TPA: HD domain-containing protein [Methanotrichaceae archaeon]|nr:HD domain-containing protein [Methanotrichaceae archaeon]